jgi:hypothetical protein
MTDLPQAIEGPVNEHIWNIRWRYEMPLTIDNTMKALQAALSLGPHVDLDKHDLNIKAHPKDIVDWQDDVRSHDDDAWLYGLVRGGPQDEWRFKGNGLKFFVDGIQTEGTWEAWLDMEHKIEPVNRINDPMEKSKVDAYDELLEVLHEMKPQDLNNRNWKLIEALRFWKNVGEPGYKGLWVR